MIERSTDFTGSVCGYAEEVIDVVAGSFLCSQTNLLFPHSFNMNPYILVVSNTVMLLYQVLMHTSFYRLEE